MSLQFNTLFVNNIYWTEEVVLKIYIYGRINHVTVYFTCKKKHSFVLTTFELRISIFNSTLP